MADSQRIVPIHRQHLEAMSDATGIMQHAVGDRPDPRHGYCTDDVARALRVDLLHQRELGWAAVAGSAARSLLFLEAAFLPGQRRFRNFRAVDGAWLDDGGSEDCQGRALHALGETILLAPDPGMTAAAARLLVRATSSLEITALRARSSALLGVVAAARAGVDGRAGVVLRQLASDLEIAFRASRDPGWRWPEPVLTYENGLPVQALIAAGDHLGDAGMVSVGTRALDWLVDIQTAPDGHLSPVGNGWWPRGGPRSQFDQQPIEAASLLLAADAALVATGEPRHRRAMAQAYGWFVGTNDVGIPVAVAERGACFDGLGPSGVNVNMGAESTLAWHLALEHMRRLRARPAAVRPASAGPAAPGRHGAFVA